MSVDKEELRGPDEDRELAAHFARMRTQERASAPGFPSQAELLRRKPVKQPPAVAARFVPAAAVIALVALGIGWLNYRPAADPVAIYAGIMDRQPIATDQLLLVSDSVLPGMYSVPSFDAMDLQFEQDYDTN